MSKPNNQELIDQLERYKFIAESINHPIMAVDSECKIIVLNQAAEGIFNLKASDVLGKTTDQVFPKSPPEDRILPRALEGEFFHDHVMLETLNFEKNLLVNALPITNDKAEIIGAVNYFDDITELIRLQKKSDALDQLIEQHNFILDSVQNTLVIIDKAGIVRIWNKAAEHYTGIKTTEAVNTHIRLLCKNSGLKEEESPILISLETGENLKSRRIELKNDNNLYEIIVNTKVLTKSNNEIIGVVAVGTDITEISKQNKIIEQNERLASVSQLAAGLAHEIRNPLTAVRGFIQILQNKCYDNHNYFDIVIEELDRTNSLINDFLLLAKPHETKFTKINILGLVKEIASFMNSEAILHDVQILDKVDSKPIYVTGDKEQLKQVFINVIKNAIEAISDKGKITVQSKIENTKIIISVCDTGQGISEDNVNKIFDVLFSTKDMGTGLGLSLSKQILDRHDGELEVTSEPGKGSTFFIALPILMEEFS